MKPPDDACDLCGLPLRYSQVSLTQDSTTYRFCCMGCRQVFQMLAAASEGTDPSRFKETELFRKCREMGIVPASEDELLKRIGSTSHTIPPKISTTDAALPLTVQIDNMWCPACAWVIEAGLKKTPGISDVSCSFSTDRLRCTYNPVELSPDRIISAVEKLGYRAHLPDETIASAENKKELIRFAVSAFLTMNVMMLSFSLYSGFFAAFSQDTLSKLSWPLLAMSSAVLFYGGYTIFLKAKRAITAAAFSMEALIGAGAISAYLYSTFNLFIGSIHLYYDTASMLITLTLLGKLLERQAKNRVQSELGSFFALKPTKVRICTDAHPTGRFVSIDHLQKNDCFRVEVDEVAPADGLILTGTGTIDESSLTGEPVPVDKKPGDRLRSGAIVLSGRFQVRAEGVGEDSTMGQMIRIMEKALGEKTELEGKTDRLLQFFVPAIFILAAGTGVGWFLATRSVETAMIRAVTVLVISCPCALGIAIPLARVAGISVAGKNGILVRDFSSFEAAEAVDAFIFDKTGTMTQGKWNLLEIIPVDPFTEKEVLALAAALEKTSDHYIAAEIRRRAEQEDLLDGGFRRIEALTHHNNGISGRIDGKTVKIGARSFLTDIENPGIDNINKFIRSGRLKDEHSAVFMSCDEKPCGVFIFGDAVRESAKAVSQALASRGYFMALISGDDEETTRNVAKKIGIDRAFGGKQPHEKAAYIEELKKKGRHVAMVGDGINDAPALASAHLAVAVYSGSHLGKETADITLMKGDPGQVLDYLSIAKKVNHKVHQNLICALFYNLISIPVAIAGFLSPLVAVGAMFMSSLTVIGNTLLLIKGSQAAATAPVRTAHPVDTSTQMPNS